MSITDGLSMSIQFANNDALNAIRELQEDMIDMGEQSRISVSKVNQSLAVLGMTVGAVFDQMMEDSPSLQIAMMEIDLAFENITRTLGEALAPIIEEVILPLVQSLVDWFMALDPEVQKAIALFIGLTAALIALAPIIIAIVALIAGGGGSILVAIVLVIAAITLLYFAWENNFGGIRDITIEWWENDMKPAFEEFMEVVGEMGGSFAELWEIIGPIVAIIARSFIVGLMEFLIRLVHTLTFVVEGATKMVDVLIQIFRPLLIFWNGLTTTIEGIMIGDWGLIFDGLVDMVRGIIYTMFEIFDLFFGTDLVGWGNDVEVFIGDIWDNFKLFFDWLNDVDVGSGISFVFENITTGLIDAVSKSIEWIIEKINELISFINTQFSTVWGWFGSEEAPQIDLLGSVPTAHTGGYINTIGETPLMVTGGEFVLNRGEVQNMGGPSGVQQMLTGGGSPAGGGITIKQNITLMHQGFNDREAKKMAQKIMRYADTEARRRSKF